MVAPQTYFEHAREGDFVYRPGQRSLNRQCGKIVFVDIETGWFYALCDDSDPVKLPDRGQLTVVSAAEVQRVIERLVIRADPKNLPSHLRTRLLHQFPVRPPLSSHANPKLRPAFERFLQQVQEPIREVVMWGLFGPDWHRCSMPNSSLHAPGF